MDFSKITLANLSDIKSSSSRRLIETLAGVRKNIENDYDTNFNSSIKKAKSQYLNQVTTYILANRPSLPLEQQDQFHQQWGNTILLTMPTREKAKDYFPTIFELEYKGNLIEAINTYYNEIQRLNIDQGTFYQTELDEEVRQTQRECVKQYLEEPKNNGKKTFQVIVDCVETVTNPLNSFF